MGDDDFDEEAWNDGRVLREEEVKQSAVELMAYMGCNHIVLPLGDDMEVKIVPKETK